MVVAAVLELMLSILASVVLTRRILTPLALFGTLWNGLLLLSVLGPVRYVTISTEARWVLILSYLAFMIGAVTTHLYFHRQGSIRRSEGLRFGSRRVQPDVFAGTLRTGIRLYALLAFTGLVWWVSGVWARAGTQALVSSAYLRRIEIPLAEDLPGYLLSLGYAGCLLAGFFLAQGRGHWRFGVWLPLGVLGVYSVISGARVSVIFGVLLTITPLLVSPPSARSALNTGRAGLLSSRTVAGAMALAVLSVLFVWIGSSRGMLARAETQMTAYGEHALPSWLYHTFVYLTGPFPAFSEFISSWEGHVAPFAGVLTPLAVILQRIGVCDPTEALQALAGFREIPFRFNTYTYLADWYVSLGVMGTLLGPYALGVVSSGLVESAWRGNAASAFGASVFLAYLLFAFTGSISAKPGIWIGVAAALGMYLVATRRATRAGKTLGDGHGADSPGRRNGASLGNR